MVRVYNEMLSLCSSSMKSTITAKFPLARCKPSLFPLPPHSHPSSGSNTTHATPRWSMPLTPEIPSAPSRHPDTLQQANPHDRRNTQNKIVCIPTSSHRPALYSYATWLTQGTSQSLPSQHAHLLLPSSSPALPYTSLIRHILRTSSPFTPFASAI